MDERPVYSEFQYLWVASFDHGISFLGIANLSRVTAFWYNGAGYKYVVLQIILFFCINPYGVNRGAGALTRGRREGG